jgi:hypothetical protein
MEEVCDGVLFAAANLHWTFHVLLPSDVSFRAITDLTGAVVEQYVHG